MILCAIDDSDAAQGVLDVLSGGEPQAVADPAWRTHRAAHPCTKEIHAS